MRVKANKTFGGKISMHAGEVREIEPGEILADLLRAGYVVELETEKKNTKKKVKAVED